MGVFYPRNGVYSEVSIDNRSALCDRHSGGSARPRVPDPLILTSGLGGTSAYFPFLCLNIVIGGI